MPRIKRPCIDNAVYHILNRGHDRRKLFIETEDFKAFKAILAKYKEKFSFSLYHYCLMSNHFHLLIRISKGNELGHLMKGICQCYAYYYKRRYRLSGYLFQNRYKSFLIEKDEYLLECARYIERNPVRAAVVSDPINYHWSSYRYYARGIFDILVTPNPLYTALSASEKEQKQKYIDYVATSRPYETILDDAISNLK